eukprot:jgi/Orpsp1_1/1188865/evm.model.d7180000067778.1
MIHQKENLINTRDYHINIHFANGDIVKSELIGQYIGLINNHKIILNDVLYVPSFKRSLLSIDHLSEDNFKTVFYKNKHNNKKCAILYNNNNNINETCSLRNVYNGYTNEIKNNELYYYNTNNLKDKHQINNAENYNIIKNNNNIKEIKELKINDNHEIDKNNMINNKIE